MTIDSMIPNVLLELRGLTPAAARLSLIRAIKHFCDLTRVWQNTETISFSLETPGGSASRSNLLTADLSPPLNSLPLSLLSTSYLDKRALTIDSEGSRVIFDYYKGDVDEPANDVDITYNLTISATATDLPYELAPYKEAIEAWAKYFLCMTPGRPYTDLNVAGYHREKAHRGVRRADTKSNGGISA